MTVIIRVSPREIVRSPKLWITAVFVLLMCTSIVMAQLQPSGNPTVTIGAGSAIIGKVGIDQTTPGTTNAVSIAQIGATTVDSNSGTKSNGTIRVVLATDQPQLTNALKVDGTGGTFPIGASSNIIGFVRIIPAGCSAQSTAVQLTAVQVATGAGTALTAVTSCVQSCYANNLTNSAVTLRLADKSGGPVIWLGGNADYSLPANSNVRVPLAEGIVFTSGIQAIAGTATAINLGCSVYQ